MYGATTKKVQPCDQTEGLRGISSDLEALERSLAVIGSPSDSVTLRGNVKTLRSQLKRKINEEQVQQSTQMSTQKAKSQHQRIKAEQLHSHVVRLHQLMERERTLIQKFPVPNSIADEEPDWGGTTAVSSPLLTQYPRYNSQAERTVAELEVLQKDINDLADMQKMMLGMVEDQGRDINVFEVNVATAQSRVERGRRELGEGVLLSSSTRRKKCCIAVCVIVTIIPIIILLLVLIIVLLALRN